MMERTDRTDLHWQPLDATEREALFDQVDAFLAAAAATGRARSDPAIRRTHCPTCLHELGHQYRRWRGAVLHCPRCRWEGPPR